MWVKYTKGPAQIVADGIKGSAKRDVPVEVSEKVGRQLLKQTGLGWEETSAPRASTPSTPSTSGGSKAPVSTGAEKTADTSTSTSSTATSGGATGPSAQKE